MQTNLIREHVNARIDPNLIEQAHDETLVQTRVRNHEHLDLTTTIRSAGSRPKPLESHGIEVDAEMGEEMSRNLLEAANPAR